MRLRSLLGRFARRWSQPRRMPHVYIAGKFTAPTPAETLAHIERAEAVAAEIISQTEQLVVLVPHSLGRSFISGPGSPAYWYAATMSLLDRCDAILMLPGWDESRGAVRELARAKELGMQVFFRVEDLLAAKFDFE